MNNTQHTVRDLTPAIGAQVTVRFESLQIECRVIDAKNSWGKVRILVQPLAGAGQQWVELERLLGRATAPARDLPFSGGPGSASVYYPATYKGVK